MQNWLADSDGSAQVVADAFVLHVPAGDTGLWSTYTTLDDVRARLKVLAERKKRREEAGFVNAAGRQLAETLMRTCLGNRTVNTLEGFRKMDKVFTAVMASLRDSLGFPHFTTLMQQPLLVGGIRIDFKFEDQDWRARADICVQAGGTDLVVSMPQPYDLVVPTTLEGRVSVEALSSEMPAIGRFASLFFQASDQQVVVDVSTKRPNSGLSIVCWCKDISVRLVAKFGFGKT